MDAREIIRQRIIAALDHEDDGGWDGTYVDAECDIVDGSLSYVVDTILDCFWVEVHHDYATRFVRTIDHGYAAIARKNRITLVEKEEGCQ